MDPNNYDYTTAGFDGFLSRSIDTTTNLTDLGSAMGYTEIRYDDTQFTGTQATEGTMNTIDGKGRLLLEGENVGITMHGASSDLLFDIQENRWLWYSGNPSQDADVGLMADMQAAPQPGQTMLVNGGLYVYDQYHNASIVNGKLIISNILGTVSITTNKTGSTLGSNHFEVIPGTSLFFKVPEGITKIKITLNMGAMYSFTPAIFNTALTGNYATDLANALYRINSTGPGSFTYIYTVVPETTYTFYLAFTIDGDILYASAQEPTVFTIETVS